MEIQRQNGTLRVRGLRDLNAASTQVFREEIGAALAPDLKRIEIDLSQIGFVDSAGVGALVAIYRTANEKNLNGGVTLRLMNPRPAVQQMFELTRLHHVFQIVPADNSPK
ncbi:MAG TPA: STAS domain-containing protein [Verrucomicrobiae bacterium]|nr:STAS domain-containing protein [Verrucomicrobiae bacterium]